MEYPSMRQLKKAFKPYAVELGQLIFAWNSLHDKLSFLFELAIKPSWVPTLPKLHVTMRLNN